MRGIKGIWVLERNPAKHLEGLERGRCFIVWYPRWAFEEGKVVPRYVPWMRNGVRNIAHLVPEENSIEVRRAL